MNSRTRDHQAVSLRRAASAISSIVKCVASTSQRAPARGRLRLRALEPQPAVISVSPPRIIVVAILGAVLGGCGNENGEHSYLAHDNSSALLATWTRVDNDVSGTIAEVKVIDSLAPDAAATDASPPSFGSSRSPPVRVERDSTAFTGEVDGDSVRLQVGGEALGAQINGRLDGDTLELAVPQRSGVETVRLKRGDKSDFEPTVRKITTLARTRRKQEERVESAAITRVATAFRRALDPQSNDDPCRYVTRELAARIAGLTDSCTGDFRSGNHALSAGPQGLLKIAFVDSQSIGGDQQQPVAVVTWKLKPNDEQLSTSQVTFVKQREKWLVEDLDFRIA